MSSVLFVCHANRFRSPLAMAYWNKLARDAGTASIARSAGVAAVPGLPPLPLALDLAAAWGVDLSGHRARPVQTSDVWQADWVVVMNQSQRDVLGVYYPWARGKMWLLTQAAGEAPEDIPDISGDPREDRRLAETIRMLVEKVWHRWGR